MKLITSFLHLAWKGILGLLLIVSSFWIRSKPGKWIARILGVILLIRDIWKLFFQKVQITPTNLQTVPLTQPQVQALINSTPSASNPVAAIASNQITQPSIYGSKPVGGTATTHKATASYDFIVDNSVMPWQRN